MTETGAVYMPVEEIVPIAGLIVHVTALFVVPVTDAVNCFVCLGNRFAVSGVTATAIADTGLTVSLPWRISSHLPRLWRGLSPSAELRPMPARCKVRLRR